MESTPVYSSQTNDITVKDLILKVKEWINYLWKKKILITIFLIVGAGLGIAYAFSKKPLYVAELTFVLEENRTSSLGTYAGIASQLGIDFGMGRVNTGVFSGENIIEFLKSRLMVEKTLLQTALINGKQQSLADFYIDIYKLNKGWNNNPLLKDLTYTGNTDRSKFTLQQDSVLQVIYNGLIRKNLDISKPDKKLSFISVRCTSLDEMFSKLFTERLATEATDFYIRTKTQRSKQTVDNLQNKADSLTSLLNRTTYSVAVSQDMNLNPARNVAGVRTELGTRDKIILQTMYAEVIKNLEISKMAMAQETPIIQIIDSPILPLPKETIGKKKGGLIGGFVGGFIIITWLILRRIYREIML